jgi:hypothetical protein
MRDEIRRSVIEESKKKGRESIMMFIVILATIGIWLFLIGFVWFIWFAIKQIDKFWGIVPIG